MKRLIQYLLISILIVANQSCKTHNQIVNNNRVGKWIEYDTIDGSVFKLKSFYKNGEAVKTWKQYRDEKIVKKEKYKQNQSTIKFYHDNGKIASIGKSKLIEKEKELHWFYHGKWKYYDTNGKLYLIKIYEEGNPIETIEIND